MSDNIETKPTRKGSINKPSGIFSGVLEELSAAKVIDGDIYKYAYIRIGGQRLKSVYVDYGTETVLCRAIKSNEPIDLSIYNGVLYACRFKGEVTLLPATIWDIIKISSAIMIGGLVWAVGLGGLLGTFTNNVSLGFLVFFGVMALALTKVSKPLAARKVFGEES